ncbi:MAG: DeoR/GlpR family DNA-binding transcription regulator [Eubacteriales bacterium]
MYAKERKRIIKKFLTENGKVSVGNLSELLEVSEVTIRRDLEVLEEEGFLQRTHGGAIINETDALVLSTSEDTKTIAQQHEIADAAFHFISDGDVVMLTHGPTNVQIAKRLVKHQNLTVLTNDLLIALEFASSLTNKLIVLGGDLENHAVYGQLAINNLSNFSLNHIFVEVDGISLKSGLTVNSIGKASLIQQACSNANIVTVVCLPDNFGTDAFYRVGPVTLPNRILTSSTLDDRFKHNLFDKNIQLYTSLDLYEE